MTKEIINAIGKRQVLRYHTPVVANIPIIFGWEVDLFSVGKTGMTYEFEVKISRADFLVDKKKKKWERLKWLPEDKTPNYISYVCPENLITEDELPPFAGLYYYANGEIVEIRPPTQRHQTKFDINVIQMKVARMYSQRQFLGRTLISHLNKEIMERNAELERQRKESQDKWMETEKDPVPCRQFNKPKHMTVEVKPNFILITDIVAGQLVKQKYIGYTVTQATKKFRQFLRCAHKAHPSHYIKQSRIGQGFD